MPREDSIRGKSHSMVTEVSRFRPECTQLSPQYFPEKGGYKVIEWTYANLQLVSLCIRRRRIEQRCMTTPPLRIAGPACARSEKNVTFPGSRREARVPDSLPL